MGNLAWYGIRVRSNFEQVTADALRAKGLEEFLPVSRSRRRWSDRVKIIDRPLFPGYVFCRFDYSRRLPVLESPGVVSIISAGTSPLAIPEVEIESIRKMALSELPMHPHPYLQAGHRVQIARGPLTGAEGIIVEVKKEFRLVVSINLLQRSVAVELDREWVAPAG